MEANEPPESQWEEFEQKYGVVPNPPEQDEDFLFETYGEDLAVVDAYDPAKVWTLVDVDGVGVIIAGYHVANRTNYILTERAWESEDEEYRY